MKLEVEIEAIKRDSWEYFPECRQKHGSRTELWFCQRLVNKTLKYLETDIWKLDILIAIAFQMCG